MRSILTVCALMLVLVGPVRAGAWDCDAKGQHLSLAKSNTVTYQPNASGSMSSGDLQVCDGDRVFLSAVACRAGDNDPGENVIIGQMSATVRWFDASNKVVGALTLPTVGPIDADLFPNQLFYTSAFASSPPMQLDLNAVGGAVKMLVRCTGIFMNQSSSPTKIDLDITASYVGHGEH